MESGKEKLEGKFGKKKLRNGKWKGKARKAKVERRSLEMESGNEKLGRRGWKGEGYKKGKVERRQWRDESVY